LETDLWVSDDGESGEDLGLVLELGLERSLDCCHRLRAGVPHKDSKVPVMGDTSSHTRHGSREHRDIRSALTLPHDRSLRWHLDEPEALVRKLLQALMGSMGHCDGC